MVLECENVDVDGFVMDERWDTNFESLDKPVVFGIK